MKTSMQNLECADNTRRKLLVWTPPLVASVALPVHAQMSVCGSMPALTLVSRAKCSGDPLVSEAVVAIVSDGADNADVILEITAIEVIGATDDDDITLPVLPMMVSDTLGIDIEWVGPGSDAATCLPTSTIEFMITFSCDEAIDQTVTLDFRSALV